jgi:plastocyanin
MTMVTRLTRTGVLVIAALAVLAPRDGLTEPARKKVVTQADLDRLDKKIADQQRTLEKLIKLQQQYLQAMMALMPDASAAAATADDPPPPPDPKPVVEPRPVVKRRGAGTIVGKVKGGGGGDTFVYIEDVSASGTGTASMRQEGKQFVPQVMVVQRGTKVDFPNRDAVFHNVFSVTPDSSFDLGSYRQGETKGVTLTKPGVVNVYCNMHPQMVGYILVAPSNLYARAGADGFYRLTGVPSGKHRLVAWAPNAKPVVSEIEVADDEVLTVELEVRRGRALPHTNKDGMAYGSYKD